MFFRSELLFIVDSTKLKDNENLKYETLNIDYSRIQNAIKLSNLKDNVTGDVQSDGWIRTSRENWVTEARRKLEFETLLQVLNDEVKIL